MNQMIIFIFATILVSVVTFFYLKKNKKQYPLIAAIFMLILLSAYAVLCFVNGVFWLKEWEYMLMIAVCIPSAWIDAYEKKIPNIIVLCGLIIQVMVIVTMVFYDLDYTYEYLKSAGIGIAFIIVFCIIGMLIVKNGIGMGDIKLLLVLSLMGGIDNILSVMFFSMIVAFFMGIFELVVRRKGKTATIPFGPAILIGTMVTCVLYIIGRY